ncbi:MAG: amidohydrolase [Muribaculaceae bacterium]|nr:amidohydrolase [Muribaculaceae bacterium]
MKICDSHIHVGQFFDRYTSPQELMDITKKLGIEKYAVSSTTICEENYSKVLNELEYLIVNDNDRAYPILWLTPNLLANQWALNDFLTSGLKWCCLKIHPDLHPYLWSCDEGYFGALIALSSEYNLPILIHTGGNLYSEAGIWREKIKANQSHTFILAHSRPCAQTIEIMKEYKNVYADLAFVGKESIFSLLQSDVANRLIWGSDIPIVDFYLQQPNIDYYRDIIGYLKKESSQDILKLTIEGNFKKIFERNEKRCDNCVR